MTSLQVQPFFHPSLPSGSVAAFADMVSQDIVTHWFDKLPHQVQGAILKRQLEFTTGRLLIENLGDRLGIQTGFPLPRDSHGVPEWPSGLTGCLSHTSKSAFAIVAPAAIQNCGCDIELILSDELLRDVEPEVLTDLERLKLSDSEGHSRNLAVTLIFSAKESIYKAVFPTLRLFLEYSAFELDVMDEVMLRLHVNPEHPLADRLPQQVLVYYQVIGELVVTWTSPWNVETAPDEC